jgi:hypothetical protein
MMLSAIVRGDLEGFSKARTATHLMESASRKKDWRRAADGHLARLGMTPKVVQAN